MENLIRWPFFQDRKSPEKILNQKLPSHAKRDRPSERKYVLLENEEEGNRLFQRLREELTKMKNDDFNSPGKNLWIEYGHLSQGRSYFFVQPWSEEGWLFERSPYGWTIAKAAKIVETNTFLRHSNAWEAAVLLKPENSDGLIRISSKRLKQELVCFPIYTQLLTAEMGIGRNDQHEESAD